MGKSAPSAPNPYQSAQAQYEYGTQAASYNKALNATNEVGPTGSTSNAITGYDPTTGAPIYTQTTSLTPVEQSLLSGSQTGGLESEAAGSQALNELFGIGGSSPISIGQGTIPQLQTTLDTSNVTPLPNAAQIQGIDQAGTNSVLQAGEAAMDPTLNAQFEALHSSLVNSGNGPGSPAYETAMSQFMAGEGGDFSQLAGQAATAGSQIGATTYGEAATSNQQQYTEDLQTLVTQNQAQGMNESDALQAAQAQMQQRSALASLGTGLESGASVNIPTASGLPTAGTSSPDIMQAFQNAYQGQLASYNANVGTEDAGLGALSSLAALAIFSDVRVKKDIEEVGETPAGLPTYLFHYIGEDSREPLHLGVMAQEVEQLFPDAVDEIGGIKRVDYSRIA
jgi:Chaperone of endosialidase